MTGLEKIVEKISEQSEEACLKIIDDANQQASDIILKAKEQAIEKAIERDRERQLRKQGK